MTLKVSSINLKSYRFWFWLISSAIASIGYHAKVYFEGFNTHSKSRLIIMKVPNKHGDVNILEISLESI